MGSIPDKYTVTLGGLVGVGLGGGVAVDIKNIPTINLSVEKIPDLHLSIDKLPPIKVEPLEIQLTRFPDIRGHLPADFCVGLSVLGMELMNLRLCGEAQIITEPYHPNPCERCGPAPVRTDALPGLVQGDAVGPNAVSAGEAPA